MYIYFKYLSNKKWKLDEKVYNIISLFRLRNGTMYFTSSSGYISNEVHNTYQE